MKKYIAILIAFVIILSSCGISAGSSTVTITLPATLFEGQSESDIIEEAKSKDIIAVKNNDGSYDYTMPKSTHEKLLKDFKKSIDDSIEDIVNGDTFTSYIDIKYNNDVTKFSLYVNQDEFENNLFARFAVFGLSIMALFYQSFNGVKSDDLKVNYELINNDTDIVYDTFIYPDFN